MKNLDLLKTKNYSKRNQYLISISLIVLTSIVCFFLVSLIGYRAVALILLLAVSLLAILFEIFPVLVAALLSAFIWNFFFIPPTLTLHVRTPEDALMFLMYFVVALINAVLTNRIRKFEQRARDEKRKEESIELYNTLLNSLSHELRTPISTIIGAIDTLKDNKEKLSVENENELFTEIERAANRLDRQVENLLNISRLEAGVLQPKRDWTDLNEVVHSVIKTNSGYKGSHKIEFKEDDNLALFKTDRGFLEQILNNVVHNAIQHTPENTIIRIFIDRVSCGFKIVVTDNGTGFPDNEIGLVFDKFYRLKNSRTGGTGLGLSIAKGFTEALGGKILLENQVNGGAVFTIEIPAEASNITSFENE